MNIKIAIVGRPNVGKSTLFNKLIHKKTAIAFDTPGITRDTIEANCKIGKIQCTLIDTAGFDNTSQDEITQAAVAKSVESVKDANIILFVTDGRTSLTILDLDFAKILRKFSQKVILVCNKCESGIQDPEDIYKLGFSNFVQISAEHKIGFKEMERMIKNVLAKDLDYDLNAIHQIEHEAQEYSKVANKISLAIVGRPNAGKSTLFNKILGRQRSIVSEIAGTTRDSIHVSITHNETEIDLVDTAGIRKRLKINDKIEEMAVQSAFYSIKFAGIVILCIDGQSPFDSQDMKIARFAIQEGRGIIIVINKWDLLTEDERKKSINSLEEHISSLFHEVKGVPYFTISAKNDENVDIILSEAILLHKIWSKRIHTSKLTGFIRNLSNTNPAPKYKGTNIKLKFAAQVNTRPPTFCIFTNIIEGITNSYQAFLETSLRREFGIFGVPIRFNIRKSNNPFDK